MSKKITSMMTLVAFVVLMLSPSSAFAVTAVQKTVQITASGTLGAITEFNAVVVDGGSVDFNSDGSNLVVTGDSLIKVTFNANAQVFKAIAVTTNNQGGKSGLVGASDGSSVPLCWTVFGSVSEASAYSVDTYADGETIPNPNNPNEQWDVSGQLDPTYQPYVQNTADITSLNEDDLSYANVIWDINGMGANLADAPYSNAGPGNHDLNDPRTVDNGEAFIKLYTDYHNATPQEFGTSINLTLVTIS